MKRIFRFVAASIFFGANPSWVCADETENALYPIALSAQTLAGATTNSIIPDIYNGAQPGNFGWLTWSGSPSVPTLVNSLTPPGDSQSYINPDKPDDHTVSAGDWIRGKPGVSNSKNVRTALDVLKTMDIVVPVWDATRGQGANAAYRVSGFARVRIISYTLPAQNRITARFLGYVTVNLPNQPPIAQNLTITTVEDQALNSTLAATDPENEALTYQIVAAPAHGTLAGAAPDLTYTPAADYAGADSFTFTATDVSGAVSAPATVSITVTAVNDAPVATAQAVTLAEDTPLAVTLAGTDPEGEALTYRVVAAPAHGALAGAAPDLTYTPAADYAGPDSFTFTATDASGAVSAPATVAITVTPVNDAPAASAQAVTLAEDTPLDVTLAGTDPEGEALTYRVVVAPAHGALAGAAPDLTYTPPADYAGTDSFTFTATDASGAVSAPAAVSITVTAVNDAPVATAQAVTLAEDTPLAVTLAGTDPEGEALTFRVVAASAHGTLAGVAPDLTYTPAADYAGADSFTVTATDASGAVSAPAAVSVTVTPVNDAPQLVVPSAQTVLCGGELVFDAQRPVSVRDVDAGQGLMRLSISVVAGALTPGATNGLTWISDASDLANRVVQGRLEDLNGMLDGLAYRADSAASTVAVITVTINDLGHTGAGGPLTQTQAIPVTIQLPEGWSVDAGPDRSLPVPGSISLSGVMQIPDPQPGVLTNIVWSRISGPGPVIFAEPGSLLTPARFEEPGTYTLMLSVEYGGEKKSDVLHVVSAYDAPGMPSSLHCAKGTDFWLGDLGNQDRGISWPENQDGYLGNSNYIIVSDVDTRGEVEWTEEDYLSEEGGYVTCFQEFTVRAGVPTIIYRKEPDWGTIKFGFWAACWLKSDEIEFPSYHITTDEPVTVSVHEYSSYCSDSYLAMPSALLGTNYLVLTYRNSPSFNYPDEVIGGTEFVVVAPQDDTHITILPKAGSGARAAGVPFEVTLQSGEDFRLVNSTNSVADFTGTEITSDKPVAVFGGNTIATVPASTAAGEHLCEQMPPVEMWGRRYLTLPFSGRANGDTFRVLAAFDGTEIFVNGESGVMLNRGEFYECVLDAPSDITASQPVLVAQFANGAGFDNSTSDPTMVLLPAVERYGMSYPFTTPFQWIAWERSYVNPFTNFVNVIVATQGMDSVSLDGSPVEPGLFVPIADSGFAGAQVPISCGAHSLKASVPCGAVVYGWAEYASYAQSVGSVYRPPDGEVKSWNVAVRQDTPYACTGAVKTVVARVTNTDGQPLSGMRVAFEVSGAHSRSGYDTANQQGDATFSYCGDSLGRDVIQASLAGVAGAVTNTWTLPGLNHAPVIQTAPFREVCPGVWHEFAATVSDDGQPAGSSLDIAWRVVSGRRNPQMQVNGPASVSNRFDLSGTYVLEVTASDGQFSSRELVTVLVNDPPRVVLIASSDDHGGYPAYDHTVSSGDEVFVGQRLKLAADAADRDGVLRCIEYFDGDTKIWEVWPTNNTGLITCKPEPPFAFSCLLADTNMHSFTVVVTDNDGARTRSNTLEYQAQRFRLSLLQTTPQSLVDTEKWVSAHVVKENGELLEGWHYVVFTVEGVHSESNVVQVGQFGSAEFGYAGFGPGVDVITASLYGQTATITNLWKPYSGNAPPVIEMEPYQIAGATQPFQPVVTVTDDGVPGAVSVAWRVLTATPSVDISDPDSLDATLFFDGDSGWYELELIASDSEFYSRATVTVTIDRAPSLYDWSLSWQGGRMVFSGSYGDYESETVRLELYEGDTLVRAVDNSYTEIIYLLFDQLYQGEVALTLPPPRNGDLCFKLHVRDDLGNVTVSGPIRVTVGTLPTLGWLTPSATDQVVAGEPVTLSVAASDSDGAVAKVDYYRVEGADRVFLGQGVSPDYAWPWTPSESGDYLLLACATDNDELTSGFLTNHVHVAPPVPKGTIIRPWDGATIYHRRPTAIGLTLNDPQNRFSYAEFFADGVSLGQTTNTLFNWMPAQVGDCTLTAAIHDQDGQARSAENAVTVHVVSAPRPAITITSPVAGSRVRANAETVVAVGVDDPAALITNLSLRVDGMPLGQNATRFPWRPIRLGSNVLSCAALTADGESVAAAPVTVNVVELYPPFVTLLTPTNFQRYVQGQLLAVSAEASDPDTAISSLLLKLDEMVLGEALASTLTEDVSDIRPGWHTAAAQATDSDGLVSASPLVRFFVERGENPELPVLSELSASPLSASEIQLSWAPLATNEATQKIIVERWLPERVIWDEVADVQAVSTNYTDTDLTPETNYRYRIACTDTNGNRSAYSAETNATTRTVVPEYAVVDLNEALSGLLDDAVPGGNILTNSGLTHFDIRRTKPLGARHAQAVLGAQAEVLSRAVARFNERWPQIRLDLDPVLLSPQSIMPGTGYLTGPSGSGVTVSEAAAQLFDPTDPDRPVKAFLQEYRDLFGFGPEALAKAGVQRDSVSPLTGTRAVAWQQQVGGIPVFNALFIGHVTATGELAAVSCGFIPSPAEATDPGVLNTVLAGGELPVNGPQALQAAVENVGDVCSVADVIPQSPAAGVTRGQSLTAAQGIKGNAYAELTWFPVSRNEVVPAWQVLFTSRWRSEMFLTVIDARDSQVLYRRNLTSTGTPATYRVYAGGSPAPLSPGLAAPGTAQPEPAERALVTLAALDDDASPDGWISNGLNETRGNNADAHLDRDDDDAPDQPRPSGSPFRTFDFALNPDTGPGSYGDAAVVQLFFWNNWMHDTLYRLGFTEAGGNFQNDNFGRGGLGGDAMQADAQDGFFLGDGRHHDNAKISVPPDGYAPRIQMYVFDGANPDRDGSLDAEIILHEYTHGLSVRTVGGGVGIDALQTAGMGEGWSDFFALALLADPAADADAAYPMGAYVAYHGFGTGFDQNGYFGLRRYPYCTDTNKNPLTYADIDPTKAGPHAGVPCNPLAGAFSAALAGEVHRQGEVWGVMLWEVRANLIRKHGYEQGNQLALALAAEGMRLSPMNPTYVQARDAILLADRMLSEGADASEIWAAFTKRGLGYDAKAPTSYTTVGVRASGEPPPALVTEQVEVLGGNGNGIIEAGEVNNLVVTVRNQGAAEATQVAVNLSTATPGVQLLQAGTDYGAIPPNQARANAAEFQICTAPEFAAGTTIELSVTVSSAESAATTRMLTFYTGGAGAKLPGGDDASLNAPTSGSAAVQDLTPWDLGNLEPLWMAEDASCLLKAARGKYVLWRPDAPPVVMAHPGFLAHRLTRHGVVVGELAKPSVTDAFGNVLNNSVGAVWLPGDPEPEPLTAGAYAYPKWAEKGDFVGVAYDLAHPTVEGALNPLGGVSAYPAMHTVWDRNADGRSAGAASVYLRPDDADGDGTIGTNDVLCGTLEWVNFRADGRLDWMDVDERAFSAGYSGGAAVRTYYNAFLTSAAQFEPGGADWRWLGPLNVDGGSAFSLATLINDRGDVAGTASKRTGDPQLDAYGPTRVFRWSPSDGEFTSGFRRVRELGVLPGGVHAFPFAMNQAGDIAGYSDFDIFDPNQLHAALWAAGETEPQDLGVLEPVAQAPQGFSLAFALNEGRQIVGTSLRADENSGAAVDAAVLWQWNKAAGGTPGWEICDLDRRVSDPDLHVFSAVGINPDGWILAAARRTVRDGQGNAVREETRSVLLLHGDLDIDSDNSGDAYGGPGRTDGEDRIEDADGLPGKILTVNDADADGDGIPDFADGFDLDGVLSDDDASAGDRFVPLVLELPRGIDVAVAHLELVYSASDPAAVTRAGTPPRPQPGAGDLRLWRKDGGVSRGKASAYDPAAPGDYLPSGVYTDLRTLGFPASGVLTNTFYVEGVRRCAASGSGRIAARLDPDGPGPMGWTELDAVRVTVLKIGLIPDYDRDGKIDETDRDKAASGEVFRFWINDDQDVGYTAEDGGTDIPGQAGDARNCDDIVVNGRRDLLDFFPVWLDMKNIMDVVPPSQGVEYRLRSRGLKFAYTALTTGSAGSYLRTACGNCGTRLNQDAFEAAVLPSEAAHETITVLSPTFLRAVQIDANRGVLMIEGASISAALHLDVVRPKNDDMIVSVRLPLIIMPVEEMYERSNLRSGAAVVTSGSTMPQDNGKHVVFLHGFRVPYEASRAWGSEMFKRFWQSGSNARFHNVTWYGDDGMVSDGGLNYHANVVHAFEAAPYLANYVNTISAAPANKIVMAHSLGNMVVSAAIEDHNMKVGKYFMFNAAVAAEAFDVSTWRDSGTLNPLVSHLWAGYPNRAWSAKWHEYFLGYASDDRSKLTWKERFEHVPASTLYNYYSSGDEVLSIHESDPVNSMYVVHAFTGYEKGNFAWQKQERFKGRAGDDIVAGFAATDEAGWGFGNPMHTVWETDPSTGLTLPFSRPYYPDAAAAALAPPDQLRDIPVFKQEPPPMFADSISVESRNSLLARAVPALSGPVGSRDLKSISLERNMDMNTFERPNDWGRNHAGYGTSWMHGDLKDMAYFYNFKVHGDVVEKGEIK